MKPLLVVVALGLLAASCAPSTPQTRIQQHPQQFAALSTKEQSLVQRGELAKGMSPDAVLLAWGSPAMRYEGYQQGRAAERWDYTAARPVYANPYFGAYSFAGYGHYGHYPYSGYGFGFGPELAYLPYCRASVWFVGNRVDSWERLR
jgi:hypothetical protein